MSRVKNATPRGKIFRDRLLKYLDPNRLLLLIKDLNLH